jgi:heme O synthase-like polyprenyltransferase
MIGAYVESLKLRVGTFIGMAAVLGYFATLPTATVTQSLASVGLLFAVTVVAAGGAGALNHFLDRDLPRAPLRGRARRDDRARALTVQP